MAQRFDPRSRELTGEPFPLNDQMTLMGGRGAFSVSETGLLGYSVGPTRALARLTWMDRHWYPIEPVGEYDSYFDLALSPDDRRVAISSEAARRQYRYLGDRFGSSWGQAASHRLMQGSSSIRTGPVTEAHLSFTSNRSGPTRCSGARPMEAATTSYWPKDQTPPSQSVWSPNGKFADLQLRRRGSVGAVSRGRTETGGLRADAVRREQPGFLTRRPLDRVQLRSYGPPRDLRSAVPVERPRAQGLPRWGKDAPMAD